MNGPTKTKISEGNANCSKPIGSHWFNDILNDVFSFFSCEVDAFSIGCQDPTTPNIT